MKRILLIATLLALITSANFAQGLTQYELAELLVNKAIAEEIIEDKGYSEDEIISFVENHGLFLVTDPVEEVSFEVVRESLAHYETQKENIVNGVEVKIEDIVTSTALENKERVLSHEFMLTTYENRNFTSELGRFEPLDGESFVTTDDDLYPLMNKYRYELYRIFGWYAKEYNLYVKSTPAYIGLYADQASASESSPLIKVGFIADEFTLSDGIHYSVRMQTGHLYSVKYQGETLAEAREKIVATGFKQDHLVLALKDAVSLFIQDEVELNKYVDTYVADVVENEDKVYSYDKDRYETFDGYKVFISKNTGSVFYHIDYDLRKWGTE